MALALLAQPRRPSRLVLWTTVVALAGSVAAFFVWRQQPLTDETVRARLVAALAREFDATVELGALHCHLFPTPGADGQNLVVRHRGRTDVPPLLRIDSFHAEATPLGLLRHHLSRLEIRTLDIAIPPAPADSVSGASAPAPSPSEESFVIDELEAQAGHVVILPGTDAAPLAWAMTHLRVEDASLDTSTSFEAALTNVTPPGDIIAHGWFGPWQRDAPGRTPVSGGFTLEKAQLAAFEGLHGTLSSRGAFAGSIDSIEAHGTADSRDFTVDLGGHAVPLHAQYDAHVDGASGDTLLRSVKATWLHTTLTASGRISHGSGGAGPTVAVDATIESGRFEDLLVLTVPSSAPPMSGQLRARAAVLIPPGGADLIDKAQLKGQFRITGARFADGEVRRRINALSAQPGKGQDVPPDPAPGSTQFAGTFGVSRSTLAIPTVAFDAPGAAVALRGHYGLRSGALDFHGTLVMASSVSDTAGGVKHVLLKLVDPLFKRKGGPSVVPIRISGTRDHPSVSVDAVKVMKP